MTERCETCRFRTIDEKCARYPIHYPLPYPQFCGEYKPKDKSDEI